MINLSRKYQFKLTITFSLIFMVLSGIIYIYFINIFEGKEIEKLKIKANVFIRYFENNPEAFSGKQIENEELLTTLIEYNKVNYIVLKNNSGRLIKIFISDEEANNHFTTAKYTEGIDFDKKILRLSAPVFSDEVKNAELMIGFSAAEVISKLKRTNLLTALFGLSILLTGIILTSFLSSISFKPIARIITSLDRVARGELNQKIDYDHNDEMGELVKKINLVISELELSSTSVKDLNARMDKIIKRDHIKLRNEIRQRKMVETSLKESEIQFQLMFENAPIGMVILSPEGYILDTNQSFSTIIGYTREELLNIQIFFLFDDKKPAISHTQTKPDFNVCIDDINAEKVFIKKDSKKVNCLVRGVSLGNEDDEVKHYIMQVLDITEIKRVQNELTIALEKAKKSDELKSVFLAQMSHEIRTPLNVIITSSFLLSEEFDDVDEDLSSILFSMRSSGKRLQRTIDLILNMSSVQSNNYKPDYEQFKIEDELLKLIMESKTLCEEKGLNLSFENLSSDSNITADKYTINQIFQNLLSNAIKYTNSGYIDVNIKDVNPDKLEIEVRDSGIGMSKEYLNNLFEPFSQENQGDTREYEGNGLGLALVKKYVEINHGEIKVKSKKDVGTVFTLTFNKSKNSDNIDSQKVKEGGSNSKLRQQVV